MAEKPKSKKTSKTQAPPQDIDGAGIEAGKDVGGSSIQPELPTGRIKFRLAVIFMVSFLVIIGLFPFLLLVFGKIKVNDFKDIVLTLAGVLGGPFSIVMNNYFKEGQDR